MKRTKSWLKRLPALIALTLCFVLFQNFSLDHEFKDIRTFAPQGVPEEPRSGYFPERIQSTNLQSLSNELLKHNFGDELHHIEDQLKDWAGWELGTDGSASPQEHPGQSAATRQPSSYHLRTGLLGKDRVGFTLESGFRLKCEYSALGQDLHLSLDRSLGRHSSLSFKHKSENQHSSVNFSYAW